MKKNVKHMVAIGVLVLIIAFIYLYINRDKQTGCLLFCSNTVTDGSGTYKIVNGKRIKIN